MGKYKPIYLIYLALLAYLLYLFYEIAWFDSLTSVANDSVNYLVMARHYSPWLDESEAIRSVWPLQDFPPLFPLLLAATGAAHSFLYAHALVGLLGIGSLYLLYRFASTLPIQAISGNISIIIFLLAPGYILGMQGILSETLFLFLSILFLLLYQTTTDVKKATIAGLGVLLAAVMLTRTIGIALWIAVLMQGLLPKLNAGRIRITSLYITGISLCIYLITMALFGPEKSSHYSDVFVRYFSVVSVSGMMPLIDGYLAQLTALLDSWRTFWIIYWVGDFSVTHLVVILLLILAIVGLVFRLRENKLDALYVLLYVTILSIWPHPGQMVRLVFPVMPILLMYAIYGVTLLIVPLNDRMKQMVYGLFYSILFASVVPAHAFIHGRIDMANDLGVVPVYESFRRLDAVAAKNELLIQNKMMEDFNSLQKYTGPDEYVMYFLPSYIAILADRKGIKFPSPLSAGDYQSEILESRPDYIFITKIHPRKTRKGYDGMEYSRYLQGWADQIWCRKYIGEDLSCLYGVENK